MKERYTVKWQNITGKPNLIRWKEQYGCLKECYLSWELKEEQVNKMEPDSEETLTHAKEKAWHFEGMERKPRVNSQNPVENTSGHLSSI